MPKVTINQKRCKGCRLCVVVCPRGVLDMASAANDLGVLPAYVVREEACTGCGLCYSMCPDICIEIRDSSEAAKGEGAE